MTLDIVVIIAILLSLLIGYKMGFLRYILKLASLFSGLIITCVLITPLHSFIMDSSIGENKVQEIHVQLEGCTTSEEMMGALEFPKLVTFLLEKIIESNVESTDLALEISTSIASKILWVQCFVILFLIFAILAFIIKQIIKRVRENATVRLIDGIGGCIFSLMTFQLISYLILAIILATSNYGIISGVDSYLIEQNENSIGIFTYYYEHNFIYNFIKLFF